MLFGSAYSRFVNSLFVKNGLLIALITAVVGSLVLYIYKKQRVDDRQQAAQSIYYEILSAEGKLTGLRERFFAVEKPTVENILLVESENWSRYRHLLHKPVLSDEEWNLVDKFFSNCIAYDSAVKLSQSYFHQVVDQNYRLQYEYFNTIIKEHHEKTPTKPNLTKSEITDLLNFQNTFLAEDTRGKFDYYPYKPIIDARKALVELDTSISLSSAGQKIKKLANIK